MNPLLSSMPAGAQPQHKPLYPFFTYRRARRLLACRSREDANDVFCSLLKLLLRECIPALSGCNCSLVRVPVYPLSLHSTNSGRLHFVSHRLDGPRLACPSCESVKPIHRTKAPTLLDREVCAEKGAKVVLLNRESERATQALKDACIL